MMSSKQTTARKNRRLSRPQSSGQPPALSLRARFDLRMGQFGGRLQRLRGPFMFALRVTALGAAATGAVAVGQLVEQHVRTSPSFATREISLAGAVRLDRDEVLETAGLALDQNVFEVGPEEAQARLLSHPWIATANVTRRLPDSYRIEVVEHRAVAMLALGDVYLVADDASVFKQHGPGDPVDLPVITGIDADAFQRDAVFRTTVLVSAIALLHDYRDVGLWRREPIAEIHVDPDASLSLYVGEDAVAVRLGRRPFRKKLRRFRKVLDRLHAQSVRPAYVYLDNVRRPDRVTVRLR